MLQMRKHMKGKKENKESDQKRNNTAVVNYRPGAYSQCC